MKRFQTNRGRMLAAFVMAVAFFGVSLSTGTKRVATHQGPIETLHVDFGFNESLHAAENAWGFVRQSATWARSNSLFIDGILAGLIRSGLLSSSGTSTFAGQTLSGLSGTWTLRLTVGANESVTSSAYTGSKTFANKFEIWRDSDNAKAVELFFNAAGDVSGDGALIFYQLNVLQPGTWTGDNVIVESYVFGNTSERKQTYSWSGGKFTSDGITTRGRVILEEMDGGTLLCFKSVVALNTNICTGASGTEYYSLAYPVNVAAPNETTAKFGLADGSVDNSGTICGANNSLNYGLFLNGGFVSDGTASSAVPSNYPPSSRTDTLFAEINTSGQDAWDDTTQATIDGLNIQFKSTAAP